jgi:hypothetical protein
MRGSPSAFQWPRSSSTTPSLRLCNVSGGARCPAGSEEDREEALLWALGTLPCASLRGCQAPHASLGGGGGTRWALSAFACETGFGQASQVAQLCNAGGSPSRFVGPCLSLAYACTHGVGLTWGRMAQTDCLRASPASGHSSMFVFVFWERLPQLCLGFRAIWHGSLHFFVFLISVLFAFRLPWELSLARSWPLGPTVSLPWLSGITRSISDSSV